MYVQPRLATAEIGPQDAGKVIELRVGDELTVSLPGNPSTDYGWEPAPMEGALLEPVSEPEFQPENDLTGAPGMTILHFRAAAAGQQTHQLVYRRSYEQEVEPADRFEFTIKVKD